MDGSAPSTSTPPHNPLQNGQWVYRAQEAAFIAAPADGTAVGHFQRLAFSSAPGDAPGIVVTPSGEPVTLADLSTVLDVRVVSDVSSVRQQVMVLRRLTDGMVALDQFQQAVGHDSAADSVALTTLSPLASSLTRIVDFLPPPDGSMVAGPLLLGGTGEAGVVLSTLDLASRQTIGSQTLPESMTGDLKGGYLVRRQLSSILVLLVARGNELTAYTLPTNSLARCGAVDSQAITSVRVGSVGTGVEVSAAAVQLSAATPDQQLVVTFADPAGSAQLVVLGFDARGDFATLQTPTVSSRFGHPSQPRVRVTAADLNSDGLDEVIMAFPATYGGVEGAAALMLFAADHAGMLSEKSSYVAANANEQALASLDLHVAAGVFGDGITQGVLVIGAGATLGDLLKGEAEILAGVVPVDPITTTFPQIASRPAVLPSVHRVGLTTAGAARFFGMAADFGGLSVVLGTPTFRQVTRTQQILAILSAPPFDSQVARTRGTLAFSQHENEVQGYNVSSNQTWLTSNDVGVTGGIAGQQVGRHISNTYGKNFDKLDDHSTVSGVQISTITSDEDYLLLYGRDYWVWEYPVRRVATDKQPLGTLLVIFPAGPDAIQEITPAYRHDFGYRQPFENGCLLSYVGLIPDGYDPADSGHRMFQSRSVPVTRDANGSTITYDRTNTIGGTLNRGYSVHNTTGDNAHFAANTTLFSYVPASFGLNLSDSQNYSDNDLNTTSWSRTDSMVISFSSGSVTDDEYQYQVTPVVYQHTTLGCLTVAYNVELIGPGWNQKYQEGYPMVVKPHRTSENLVFGAYTPAISFEKDAASGVVKISVEIFNRSLGRTVEAHCECYVGQPQMMVQDTRNVLTTPGAEARIGPQADIVIEPLRRETVSFDWPNPIAGSSICVKVWGGGRPPDPTGPFVPEIAWSTYLPEPPAAPGHDVHVELPS
jgi:hypothetical protein